VGRARTLDWDAITGEAVSLLSEYLRLDTVNPPGNERLACDWLGRVLDHEGIPYRLYARDPYRPTLVATLPGDGSRGRALVLLNHTDVVPIERDGWAEEPFAGLVKDGVIWGRGALDMKGMGIMELIAVLLMRRLRLPHRRDIVFLAVADEEAGSEYGVEFLAREHPDALEAEYVLNEGGWGTTEALGTARPAFNCSVSEKGPCWLTLVAEGRPGHGSIPHDDNALARLVRALGRVLDWQRPRSVVPEVDEYFARAHRHGYLAETPTHEVIGRLGAHNPLVNAITTNTISLTTIRAGVKHNVIPARAEATLDCRLLPGAGVEAFIAEVARVIDDPKVRIERGLVSSTPTSPADTELMRVIEDVAREHIEEAAVLPSVSAGFTDSRVFRRQGVTAYGFVPVVVEPAEAATIHGHNERLSVENLRLGCQVLFEVVRRISE
jgi:acetylornithine deacetylase/succinyl-diaminopimelate desuccinylase-like protein